MCCQNLKINLFVSLHCVNKVLIPYFFINLMVCLLIWCQEAILNSKMFFVFIAIVTADCFSFLSYFTEHLSSQSWWSTIAAKVLKSIPFAPFFWLPRNHNSFFGGFGSILRKVSSRRFHTCWAFGQLEKVWKCDSLMLFPFILQKRQNATSFHLKREGFLSYSLSP